MQVVRKLTRESLQNDCIVSVGTELDIWLYRPMSARTTLLQMPELLVLLLPC